MFAKQQWLLGLSQAKHCLPSKSVYGLNVHDKKILVQLLDVSFKLSSGLNKKHYGIYWSKEINIFKVLSVQILYYFYTFTATIHSS